MSLSKRKWKVNLDEISEDAVSVCTHKTMETMEKFALEFFFYDRLRTRISLFTFRFYFVFFSFLSFFFSASPVKEEAPLLYIPAFAFHAARSVSIQSPVVRTSSQTSNTQLYTLYPFIIIRSCFSYDRFYPWEFLLHPLFLHPEKWFVSSTRSIETSISVIFFFLSKILMIIIMYVSVYFIKCFLKLETSDWSSSSKNRSLWIIMVRKNISTRFVMERNIHHLLLAKLSEFFISIAYHFSDFTSRKITFYTQLLEDRSRRWKNYRNLDSFIELWLNLNLSRNK